jgi:murein L,D-transpeptidase YcbB/YkuD
MADRDTRNDPDLDDWFDEPDTSAAWEERSSRAVRARQTDAGADDWVEPAAARKPGERRPSRRALQRRPITIAAILVVCLLVGLAAAGVFSSGHEAAPPTVPVPTTSPTTVTTPTTTQTGAAPPAPTTPLKPGDTGAAVKVLQRALAHLGYSVGTIDGQYGPSTEKAVTSFQRANGLTPDGVLGPKTRAAIRSALASG